MKVIHIIIGVIFGFFALLQYNDPDFYIWIPVYSVISYLAFSKAFGRPQAKIAFYVAITMGICMITYIPSVIDWVNIGMPDIAGSMKTESTHIELIREFFGLFLCLSTAIYYVINANKK